MRKIIFYAGTPLQLIAFLNIIDSHKLDQLNQLTCILSDRLINPNIYTAIKSLQIFDRIFVIPTHWPSLKHWLQSPHFQTFISTKIYFSNYLKHSLGTKYYDNFQNIFPEAYKALQDADDIYFHTKPNSLIQLTNKRCTRHLIDEGIRSYTRRSLECRPDFVYLYEPDLADFGDQKPSIIKLPKITPVRHRLITWITQLFPIYQAEKVSSCIFFDQPLGKRPFGWISYFSSNSRIECLKFKTRQLIIQDAQARSHSKLVLRAHPGSSPNLLRYLKKSYTVVSTNTPFEVELLQYHHENLEIYTIYSTAACYWLLMFDETFIKNISSNINIYYPKFLHLTNNVSDKSIQCFFENLNKKFNNINLIT
jgi:hypothetical protein